MGRTKQPSQETDQFDLADLNMNLNKVIKEKHRLECKLSVKEKKLVETMNTLTHFELKLIKAEQEKDVQCTRINRLQNDICSSEKSHQDNKRNIVPETAVPEQEFEVDYVYRESLDNVNDKDVCYNSRVNSMEKDEYSVTKDMDMKLKDELDDTHKRLKKSGRKVKDLTKLLEENSFVIESLHKKLQEKEESPIR